MKTTKFYCMTATEESALFFALILIVVLCTQMWDHLKLKIFTVYKRNNTQGAARSTL